MKNTMSNAAIQINLAGWQHFLFRTANQRHTLLSLHFPCARQKESQTKMHPGPFFIVIFKL
jgi:hypothetical protein